MTKPKLPREGWDDVDKRNEEARRVSNNQSATNGPSAPVYGAPPPFNAQMPESAAVYGAPPPRFGEEARAPIVRRGPSPLGVVVIIGVVALVVALVVKACVM